MPAVYPPGAKPAPGICFERVNSAGDPYGNCGKDSKSAFVKCEMRDAKCGKIQCQGGASRPVIGTNAVSIETNIPQQEGGRILCRGTHVYLGDDMPDPGLVLSGTKCAEGKICLNRRCQNISVFGVHKCAMQCHGRGVCNNRKNCHCEAHWAPPFCDKFGFGGSTDSGPIRQADNQGLTVGILVSILCLLAAGFVVYFKRKTLIRLLFTHKKTTMEKLRCVHPSRTPRGSHLGQAHPTLGKGLLMSRPPHSNTPKDRRSPQCQNMDISRPLNTRAVPQPQSPQRVLPPLYQAPRAPSGPARPLPAHPALRQAQGMRQMHTGNGSPRLDEAGSCLCNPANIKVYQVAFKTKVINTENTAPRYRLLRLLASDLLLSIKCPDLPTMPTSSDKQAQTGPQQ
ncbi:hypothetical protein STEG23_037842 [Scotinomys teguina]